MRHEFSPIQLRKSLRNEQAILADELAVEADLIALLPSEWALKTFTDKNEDWIISEQPFPPRRWGRGSDG
jgi:hypothetical protein